MAEKVLKPRSKKSNYNSVSEVIEETVIATENIEINIPRKSVLKTILAILKSVFIFLLIVYVFVSAYYIYGLWLKVARLENAVFPKQKLAIEALPKLAKSLGLNDKQFIACLNSGQTASYISSQENGGEKSGITGTPGVLLINLQTQKVKLLAGGAIPFDAAKTAIDDFLTGKDNPAALQDVKEFDHVLASDMKRGSDSAKFAFVEYSDLQCPFCRAFHPTVGRLLSAYGSDMVWVYRHFPLPARIHPNAEKYAEAAECAKNQGGQDAFWKMVDAIFNAQN